MLKSLLLVPCRSLRRYKL